MVSGGVDEVMIMLMIHSTVGATLKRARVSHPSLYGALNSRRAPMISPLRLFLGRLSSLYNLQLSLARPALHGPSLIFSNATCFLH